MPESTRAFCTQARSYCSFIEDSPATNSRAFAQVCLTHLLGLYQLALQLPDVEPESSHLPEEINYEKWNVVRKKIAGRLTRDYYWVVFEPFEHEQPEPVCGSLSDDLADIWRDLKPGVAVIDCPTPTSVSAFAWHWRFSFESHWGRHAASAITALHAHCFGQPADESGSELAALAE